MHEPCCTGAVASVETLQLVKICAGAVEAAIRAQKRTDQVIASQNSFTGRGI